MFALFQGGCLAALFLTHLRGQENTINQMMILISALSFAVSVAFMIWIYFQLDVRRTAHERSESRIREIFESNPNALILCDPRGRIQMVNRETEELFGFARATLVGEPIEILVPQDRRDHHKRHVEQFFEEPEKRNMGEGWDLGGRHASGREFPVSVGLTPIMMPEGLCTLAAVIDISDRVEAEEEIKRSNRELEQFAYIASHDLKSPLRGVAQLVEWIVEKLQDEADEELRRYLELLGSRVERMQVLLNSLLEYSRAGRKEDLLEQVDANDLVQSISESLAPMNGWTVRIDRKLPVLITQQSALSQVFHNLIGNAIKHHDRETGEIVVSALDNGAFVEFSVHDDGPGIRPEFHERVFGMFQTLRPRDEVEGSGMGLSLVKKLVEQQGGVIRIDSDPAQGRGTCFRFTWPREVECRRSA